MIQRTDDTCSPLRRRIKGTDRAIYAIEPCYTHIALWLGKYIYIALWSITYSLHAHSGSTDYIIVTTCMGLSVVLPKADLNYQKPLGYKSVKPRHLQAVWALEYTRAITIRALGLQPRALIVIALVYSKAHTTLGGVVYLIHTQGSAYTVTPTDNKMKIRFSTTSLIRLF